MASYYAYVASSQQTMSFATLYIEPYPTNAWLYTSGTVRLYLGSLYTFGGSFTYDNNTISGTITSYGVEYSRYSPAYIVRDFSISIADLPAITSDPEGLARYIFGGDDYIEGSAYDDDLYGREGNDRIVGDRGNDTLWGGAGADTLRGGYGADVFSFGASDSSAATMDSISDFERGTDKLHFAGMSGITFRRIQYSYAGSVQSTLDAINADNTADNQLLYFTDQSDTYVYVKGAGTGTSMDGTLVRLDGITRVGANDFADALPTLPARTTRTKPYDMLDVGRSAVLWHNVGNRDVGIWTITNGVAQWTQFGQGPLMHQEGVALPLVGTGDFDADGCVDILWEWDASDYNVLCRWTPGSDAPTPYTLGFGSLTMQVAGVGDFNGDGSDDILWQNATNNLVGLWATHPGSQVTWHDVGESSDTMRIAGVGDFNGDGTDDILWQNPTNNFVGLWTMNNCTASWQQVGYGSTTMEIAGVGDFNGDGTDDILWHNPTSNFVGAWLMNNGTASWLEIGYGSTTMQIAGIGDYEGDGTSDILWRNGTNGDVGMWQINNGQPTWTWLANSTLDYAVVRV